MVPIASLESRSGSRVEISFDPGPVEPLVRDGKVDAYIVATEDGFSPLGANRSYLSSELGVPEQEIGRLANWNRFANSRVTLVGVRSRRMGSSLRGVILAASETSECYKRFATPMYGRPYRDFYYNVTYQAIAHAAECWGSCRLAISHLSGSGTFHQDIATCNAEALAHYCDNQAAAIESMAFIGCCISRKHFAGISILNAEGQTGRHRAISTQIEEIDGHVLLHLEWTRDA